MTKKLSRTNGGMDAAQRRKVRQVARRLAEIDAKMQAFQEDKAELYRSLRTGGIDVAQFKRVLSDRKKHASDPEKFEAGSDAYDLLWLALEDLEIPEKDEGDASRAREGTENHSAEKPAAAPPVAAVPREAAGPKTAASRPPSSEPPPASDVPDIPDEFKRPTDKPHHVNPQPVPPPDDDDTYALFSDDPPAVAAAE